MFSDDCALGLPTHSCLGATRLPGWCSVNSGNAITALFGGKSETEDGKGEEEDEASSKVIDFGNVEFG